MIQTTDLEHSQKLTAALKKAGYLFKPSHIQRSEKGSLFSWDFHVHLSGGSESFCLSRLHDDDIRYTMCELWGMVRSGVGFIGNIGYNDLHSFMLYDGNTCNALSSLIIWAIDNGYTLTLNKKAVTNG